MAIRAGGNKEYAYQNLVQSVYAMIYSIYREKGLQKEFYTSLMPKHIDEWAKTLEYRGALATAANATKCVFAQPGVTEGRRMYFLLGDLVYNRLSEDEHLRLELSEMMFDLIADQAEPSIKPVVFADGDRIVNLFTLRFENT